MKGILADVHVRGPVDHLVRLMRKDVWAQFWSHLNLTLYYFEDIGLDLAATDLEIWKKCQTEQLIFLTNNRNASGPDSLQSTIQKHNTPDCLPVFTFADLNRFRLQPSYAKRVVERFYEYLLNIDDLRGTGRLFLP